MLGQTLGHYRILEKLGAGGMGVVYRARDESLQRDIALKVLPVHALADEGARARFRREALALSQLNHPHICTIYEVGEADGQSYIAMEYVAGRPLSGMVPSDGLPLENVIRYGAQIADALAHAHDRDLAHRDLKSSNVMVTPEGRVKVLDFGLARRFRDAQGDATRSRETEAGTLAGTLHYMAPEVLRGEPADARSDLWALGVMLYEMVAGELPFRGQTGFEISSAILKESSAPLPPRVPAGLRAVIQRCLAKEPGQRYQRAGEVRAALEAIHSDSAISAPVPAAPGLSRRWLLAAVVALLAALAVVLWLKGRPAPSTRIQSLAVLPLENLSGDPQQEFFADGMTDSLIADLAKIKTLRVPSRPSVMRFKGARKPLPEIASDLKVDALVVGSVVRSGDRVRISAQLIEAASEKNLWSETYERDLRDVLALQSEVARAIASEIRIQLTPEEQKRFARTRPVNPEAFEHYLRGKAAYRNWAPQEILAAIEALERAVALDPGFAAAHAELAQAYTYYFFTFAPNDPQWEPKALAAIEKAMALSPDLGEAYLARGAFLWTPSHRFPHEQAVQDLRRALSLNPNLDEAHHRLALIHIHIGLPEKAEQEARLAVAINPNHGGAHYRIGEALLYQGKYAQALEVFKEVPKAINPAVRGLQMGLALFYLGRKQEAVAAVEEGRQANPTDPAGSLTSTQALFAAASGDLRSTEEKIKFAATKRGYGHFHHTAYNIAGAYALMNKPQQAVEWLQIAVDEGFPCYTFFEKDPNLNPIRTDPAFIAFMAKLKPQWERYKATL